jgi:hypothetical protein
MEKNRALYGKDGKKRIADNALVAITLMIAESNPAEKETMVKIGTRGKGTFYEVRRNRTTNGPNGPSNPT